MRHSLLAILIAAFAASVAWGQTNDRESPHSEMHHHDQMHATPDRSESAKAQDTRLVVQFPKALRESTLSNMRDHLQALQQIQEALAKQEYDLAGDIAEQRLGMSSLSLHGAHEVAKYMPQGMQEVGSGMHRNASRFAVAAMDAGVTGDVKPALEALAKITAQCVACHAGYRVE